MRVAILGNAGSGKSTLARAIAAETGAPVLDLDTLAWEPTGAAVPRDPGAAQADVRAFCASSDRWIVEGCYADLIGVALERRPRLLLLNPGIDACLSNCRTRPWEPHKYASARDQDANLPALLAWVADYASRSGPLSWQGHLDCFGAYDGPKLELVALPDVAPLDPRLRAWLG